MADPERNPSVPSPLEAPPALAGEASVEAIDPRRGQIVGGLYRIETRIGEGGMGTVYRATHVHLGRAFAIKVLSRKVLGDADATERLKNEAIAASRIDHENIVDVVSLDTTPDGDVFIVMELLEGESLADRIERGPIALDEAVRIARDVSHALSAAHELGIVHRDLKPENVFLARRKGGEVVKVLDFGISKVKSADAESVRLTRTGQLVGTPLYMSPEQAKGEDVDARADIYSLGVILYEMLAGTPVFDGRNYFQLLWKHGNELPEPLARRCPERAVPVELDRVVLRALAKTPSDRFATMAEFEAALVAACPAEWTEVTRNSGSLSAPRWSAERQVPPRASGQHPGRIGIVAAILAGLSALGLVAILVRSGSEAESRRTTASVLEGTSPSTNPVETTGVVVAPADEPPDVPDGLEGTAADPIPASYRVKVESIPPGAQVFRGDESLGRTPLELVLPTASAPFPLRFSLSGHADRVVSVKPEEGLRVVARLPVRRTPPDRKTLPIKTEL